MTIFSLDSDTEAKERDSDVVVSVENVSKRFARNIKRSMFYGVLDMSIELTGQRQPASSLRKGEFWALEDISLTLRRGEALGLVGANGSGKTTLLRIISGLIKPDRGQVRVRGRLAPLIALGAAFNPVLTGRENLYLNMSILGLSTEQIDERFDEVVDFAELGEAIDAPIRNYSSGMRARLGFASAIYTEPNILLIDEVLAVGDVRFRGKCVRKIAKLREYDTSIIFVSHSSDLLQSICESSVYLSKGKTVVYGETRKVLNEYEKDVFFNNKTKVDIDKSYSFDLKGHDSATTKFYVTNLTIMGEGENGTLYTGEKATITLDIKTDKDYEDISFDFQFDELSTDGKKVVWVYSVEDNRSWDLTTGEYRLQVVFPQLILGMGLYNMRLIIRSGPLFRLERLDSIAISVQSHEGTSRSRFYQSRSWHLTHRNAKLNLTEE